MMNKYELFIDFSKKIERIVCDNMYLKISIYILINMAFEITTTLVTAVIGKNKVPKKPPKKPTF